MVWSSSEVYLSMFGNIRVETVRKNNDSYYVEVQGIGLFITSSYQEFYSYPRIIKIFEPYKFTYLHYCYGDFIILLLLMFYDKFILLIILVFMMILLFL